MTTFCPDCYQPTDAKPSAREGRCDWCRPRREHSVPKKPHDTSFARFVKQHERQQR